MLLHQLDKSKFLLFRLTDLIFIQDPLGQFGHISHLFLFDTIRINFPILFVKEKAGEISPAF